MGPYDHVPGDQHTLREHEADRRHLAVHVASARQKAGQGRREGKRGGDRVEALRDVRHRDPPRHRPPEVRRQTVAQRGLAWPRTR